MPACCSGGASNSLRRVPKSKRSIPSSQQGMDNSGTWGVAVSFAVSSHLYGQRVRVGVEEIRGHAPVRRTAEHPRHRAATAFAVAEVQSKDTERERHEKVGLDEPALRIPYAVLGIAPQGGNELDRQRVGWIARCGVIQLDEAIVAVPPIQKPPQRTAGAKAEPPLAMRHAETCPQRHPFDKKTDHADQKGYKDRRQEQQREPYPDLYAGPKVIVRFLSSERGTPPRNARPPRHHPRR